jgi:hypothetical protein
VNTVMNLRVYELLGTSRIATQLTASQGGLSSMKKSVITLNNA